MHVVSHRSKSNEKDTGIAAPAKRERIQTNRPCIVSTTHPTLSASLIHVRKHDARPFRQEQDENKVEEEKQTKGEEKKKRSAQRSSHARIPVLHNRKVITQTALEI